MNIVPANIILSLIFFLLSCRHASVSIDDKTGKELTENIELSSFKKLDRVTLTQTGQNGFFSTIAIVDTFLVCSDYKSPVILRIFGINSNKLLAEIINRGDQKGECLNVANIQPIGDKPVFWIYDITLGKFLKIDLSKALKDPSNYSGEEEIILTGAARKSKSPCWISDSVFAAASYSHGDCRYLSFSKKSVILGKTGRLPSPEKDWPEEKKSGVFDILASAYSANLIKHPQKEILVAAYNKTDRLEFYEQGALKKIVRGPDHFEPEVSFSESNGKFSAIETSQTLFSYTGILATRSFIYSLYSGKNNYNTCSQKLLVYDWNGNPKRIIQFDQPICYFTVRETANQAVIYAVENNTGNLCYARL
jgi:hypothetical protein